MLVLYDRFVDLLHGTRAGAPARHTLRSSQLPHTTATSEFSAW